MEHYQFVGQSSPPLFQQIVIAKLNLLLQIAVAKLNLLLQS